MMPVAMLAGATIHRPKHLVGFSATLGLITVGTDIAPTGGNQVGAVRAGHAPPLVAGGVIEDLESAAVRELEQDIAGLIVNMASANHATGQVSQCRRRQVDRRRQAELLAMIGMREDDLAVLAEPPPAAEPQAGCAKAKQELAGRGVLDCGTPLALEPRHVHDVSDEA